MQGQDNAALLALVDKVEGEKELDGSRKLVAYATVCLIGEFESHKVTTMLQPIYGDDRPSVQLSVQGKSS